MVVVIILVAAGGIIAVGNVKGWFSDEQERFAVAENVTGIVSVQRNGVSFELEKDDALEAGDKIVSNEKSEILIKSGGNSYKIAENSEVVLGQNDDGGYAMELTAGEVFAVLEKGKNFGNITAQERCITADGTVFSVNVQTGSMSVNVFEGEVTASKGENAAVADAGESISVVGEDMKVVGLDINSLNGFNLENAMEAGKNHKLCFSEEELNRVVDDRDSETEENGETEEPEVSGEEKKPSSGNGSGKEDESGSGKDSQDKSSSKKPEPGKSSDSGDKEQAEPSNKYDYSCTIEIRCDTILNNMESLNKGKEGYVPSNGVILKKINVGFNRGETVFDVLKRVCDSKGIQMEASWTPAYGSSYIEGINHIYEFDCGPQSGWVYKVNGWFPNYGCSAYKVSDGDSIVWLYTCQGYGADVGGSVNH